MSLIVFDGDQSLSTNLGGLNDILVERGVYALSGEVLANRLLTPEGCVVRATRLFVETAEVHGDIEVAGAARLGEALTTVK